MAHVSHHTHELIEACVERMVAELNDLLQVNLGVEIDADAKRVLVCVNSALIASECLPGIHPTS